VRQHPRAGVLDRWVPAVLSSRLINNACKVQMMTLAVLVMGERGYVEGWNRQRLAALTGVHPQRVAEAVGAAVRAGLLHRRGRSAPGQPASYEAVCGPIRLGAAYGSEAPPERGSGRNHTVRHAWVEAVLAADVGMACKLLMLAFAYYMKDNGLIAGVRRRQWADLLIVHESSIAKRIGEAKAAGLLALVDGGRCGRGARYRALIPRRG
jgi:hypothetical protein